MPISWSHISEKFELVQIKSISGNKINAALRLNLWEGQKTLEDWTFGKGRKHLKIEPLGRAENIVG